MANKTAAADYDEAETVRRRDEVLKRMLNTPPKPFKEHPPSREKSRKKAGAEQPVPDRGKSGPQT